MYISSGSKGGVGKSFVCMGLIDYLTQKRKKKIMLVESDTSNPDVAKAYAEDEETQIEALRLDDADGWIELVNLCDRCEHDIVINSAARDIEAVAEFGETLTGSLEELERDIATFWVINRQRDSIELLRRYETLITGDIHVVRNLFWGQPAQFELYDTSATAKTLAERGKTLDFPNLADRVADDLYTRRFSIAKGLKELPIGNRAELKRWRKLAWEMFESVLPDA